LGDTPKRVSSYVQDPHLDPNLKSILLSPPRIPLESRMAITPHPLIRFALEYMCWKALLRGFPLDGVLSMTTCDNYLLDADLRVVPMIQVVSMA
jgi:hypothetical protein